MTANKATFVLFAALLAARLAYFNQYARLPLLDGPLFDSQVYLAQAQAIASGSYGDPTLLAFSPLYGYFLYLFGGLNNPVGIVLLQHAMALGTLGIIWHALKRDHGAVAGLLGVMLLGGYGFLTFFETKLLSETLGILLLAAAIHIYCGYHLNSDRWGMGIAAGALFSLATLARASLIFCLPLLVIAPLFARHAYDPMNGRRIVRAAWVALGIAVILGSNGLWNLRNAGVFAPVILVSKTAATSSQTKWSGDLSAIKAGGGPASSWDVVEQARSRLAGSTLSESDSVSTSSSTLFGVDVLGWARRFPERFAATFRDVETTHQYRYYSERSHIAVLNAHLVTFGFLCCSAVLGIVALWKAGRLHYLHSLWPVLLGTLVTTTLIMPSARYRLPMVLPLAMMGAIGLESLRNYKRSGRLLAHIAVAAVFLGFGLKALSYTPLHPGLWDVTLAEAQIAAGERENALAGLRQASMRYGEDPVVAQRVRLLLGQMQR